MKIHIYQLLLAALLYGCNDTPVTLPDPIKPPSTIPSPTGPLIYELDLTKVSTDSFKVKLNLESLNEQNTIFQFAAAMPGIYSLVDFGKNVGGLKAYDKDSKEVPVRRLSTNQFTLSNPVAVKTISYSIKSTPSSYGANIFPDCIFFTAPSLFGFPLGGTNQEIKLKVTIPEGWTLATTLQKTSDGYYTAPNYKSFTDTHFFSGLLKYNSIIIDDTQFDIYSYAKSPQVQTAQLVDYVTVAMNDASKFFKVLPLNKYSFYFFFKGAGGGALEHSGCSFHYNFETTSFSGFIRTRAAHEFFHIVAPLNVRSEVIENFNFSTPTASQHLWLYEGVTVWAAYMMQYRNGSMPLNDLLDQLSSRVVPDNESLTEVSLGVFNGKSANSAYYKGVGVAALLDIKLLLLSNGTTGLRELLLRLNAKHSPQNPFSEKDFFSEIIQMTHPDIGPFVESYIEGKEALPVKELFDKIGIDFDATSFKLTVKPTMNTQQAYLFDQWSKDLE